MRLKTHVAPNMAEAMAQIRRAYGDDAIIVSTEESDTAVTIIVALEELEEVIPAGTDAPLSHGVLADDDPIDIVHEALLAHGMPNRLLDRLIDAAFLAGSDEPLEALTGALRQVFTFHPLVGRRVNQPLMLVGAPGSGKTVTVAKLAARAVFAKRKVRLITTDTVRAGGIEQLDAFARLMQLPMFTAESDDQLATLVATAAPDEGLVIDTPGVNPYSVRDMAELGAYVKATGAEPILVMAGGGDVIDSMEQAQAFAAIGCTRILMTRLDMVRRLGSMLAAADAARLPFCDCSTTQTVADGLFPIDPRSLARMLLPEPAAAIHSAIQGLRK